MADSTTTDTTTRRETIKLFAGSGATAWWSIHQNVERDDERRRAEADRKKQEEAKRKSAESHE